MTEIAVKAGQHVLEAFDFRDPSRRFRLLLLLVLATMAALSGDLAGLIFQATSDAFLQVTVFVAATLALVFMVERSFAVDIGKLLEKAYRWQSFFAALLGALPGCGGAIIVVTQYTRGYVTFGGVVSVLVATMGDAAFLLLAREPLTALGVMVVSIVVGTISGVVVDWIHGVQFMRVNDPRAGETLSLHQGGGKEEQVGAMQRLWIMLVSVGLVAGFFVALQINLDNYLGAFGAYQPTAWLGFIGGTLSLLLFVFAKDRNLLSVQDHTTRRSLSARVVHDTSFVTTWVIMGFLSYELAVYFAGTGIDHWFQVWAPVVPLVAILIGFVPGCGPQVVVTTLYVSGVIPLSAQLGNAIANDGDALFPAIALAPRAAFLATLYSAIPAFIVGYSYYFLFE